MKASWNGYLSLGNLNVPVQLYSALRPAPIKYVLLHAADNSPTGRTIKCLKEDKEIHASEVVRAVKNGEDYIKLPDTEIAQTGDAEKTISVRQFSDPSVIKPKYYDKPYYIVPDEGGELAYTLLRQAFVEAKKIAIATYTYYQKEHLGIISVEDGILMLQQVRFASEIIPRSEIKTASLPQPAPSQVDIAVKLMQRYSTPFYIDDYRNEHQDRLLELIDRKAKGLGPKRYKSLSPKTTKESAVIPALEELLETRDAKTLPQP